MFRILGGGGRGGRGGQGGPNSQQARDVDATSLRHVPTRFLISILCNHRKFYNRGCSRMLSDFVQTY